MLAGLEAGGARGGRRAAFALVVVLAALVLMAVLVMAFFSSSLLNRQVAYSSANLAKTDLLARASLDFIAGELRQEIVDGSVATNGGQAGAPLVYRPIAPLNAMPQKAGLGGPDVHGARTIAKVSADGQAIRPGGVAASSVLLTDGSLDARRISTNRWFGSGGPGLGSQAAAPAWFYVTRGQGVAMPGVAEAGNRASPGYVIGRFACTVYEVGGLLNANVAGHPSVAATNAARKGGTAYADLTALDTNFIASKVDAFVGWRNGAAADSAGAYDAYLTNAAIPRGFAQAVQGHNAFLSRQDLLGATNAAIGLPGAVTPYLTHFSRAVNAPSWGPAADSADMANFTNAPGTVPVAYRTDDDKPSSINRFAPNVRHPAAATLTRYADDGAAEAYGVRAGDPLLRTRFSLAKLAWITHDGPKEGIPAEAIRACFGLEWDSVNSRWEYVEKSPSPVAIMTLKQVAAAGREPNFFELLNAGILSGSVAQAPGPVAGAVVPVVDQAAKDGSASAYFVGDENQPSYGKERNLHILQIGANIIDQFDEDGYPTAIHFQAYPVDPAAQLYDLYNTVFGIENLPYLHRIYQMAFEDARPGPEAWDTPTSWKWWIVPEIWNPHQASAGASPPPDQPTHFRVRAHGGVHGEFNNNAIGIRGLKGSVIDYDENPRSPGEASSFRDLYFADSGAGTSQSIFYGNPRILDYTMVDGAIAQTDPLNYWNPDIPPASSFRGIVIVGEYYGYFRFAGIYAGSARWKKDLAVNPWKNRDSLNSRILPDALLTLSMEYWDGGGWRPYSLMSRIAVITARSSNGQDKDIDPATHYDNCLALEGWQGMHGPDSRTDRFATSVTRTAQTPWPHEATAQPSLTKQRALETYYPCSTEGFSYTGGALTDANAPKINAAMWMVNLTPGGGAQQYVANLDNTYYADPDGVVRPADGFRRDVATGDGIYLLAADQATASAARRRPVMLNRPFRSVAEMGYAYRDLPGRNVDFWSVASADAALLDLFSVAETPRTTSDAINANSAPAPVLQAMLSGTVTMAGAGGQGTLDATNSRTVAQAVATRLSDAGQSPLSSRADWAVELGTTINTNLPATGGLRANKAMAEAPVRALADVSNVRTWNLLVDVVAQAGRVAGTASQLGNFLVEGERRYWLHLAIDRYTGEVVARQVEAVYE